MRLLAVSRTWRISSTLIRKSASRKHCALWGRERGQFGNDDDDQEEDGGEGCDEDDDEEEEEDVCVCMCVCVCVCVCV